MEKNEKNDGITPTAVAAGVLAAGAAAAAGYYFYGAKHAKKHRADAVKWAHDLKSDVVKEAKRIQKLDETVVHGVIDRIAGAYENGKATAEEVRAATDELKKNWKKLRGEATSRGAKRPAKKTAKKAVKKTAKKR